ncbi:PP2C family protein-serine/threonine phosphatase [Amycolatopsis sp. NPDC098790]|uniref:PP2C family protein-serine/threonine phosphatase n=1 Tax=Amycolatopsis sp. NPDC098790 TaxID=3363939 RepID=UPI00381F0D46
MYPHLPPVFNHIHRTSTYAAGHHLIWPHALLPPGPCWTHATCRCGWAEIAESHRDARALVRDHRRDAADHSAYLPGSALRIGDRTHQADATGTHVSRAGARHGWAVADGIGDYPLAAHAAGSAAATAAYAAADRGAVAGLLAATATLATVHGGDTVMVVAAPLPPEPRDGWDIAWVGDCRAYEYDPLADVLTQLTLDHTDGPELRDSLAEHYRDRPDELEELAARHDNVVTSSVATADHGSLGHVTTTGPRRRLLLTSDGVHKPVPHASLTRACRTFSDPAACANRLTLAARYFGGTDNAAAMVIDPIPAPIAAELVP